jgi:uncharacterized protein YjbI with pentapeptide repeats
LGEVTAAERQEKTFHAERGNEGNRYTSMIIEDAVFESKKDRNSGAVFENYEFKGCTFDNCALSLTCGPDSRSKVRNVKLLGCKSFNSSIGPAIIEDTVVDGLSVNDLLIFQGAVFRHVVFKGKIGPLKIIPRAGFVHVTQELQKRFDEHRQTYYAGQTGLWILVRRVSARSIAKAFLHG